MSVQMHFSTFLKLLTQSTGDKIRDLSGYAQSGGFDFYRSSRDGVAEICAKSTSISTVIAKVKAIAPPNGIERNVEIVEHCSNWLSKQKGTGSKPKRSVWASPQKVFSVLIEPEILISSNAGLRVLAVYPRIEPRINRDQAGAGIIILKKAYKGDGTEKFGILDAYAEKAFWSPTNASQSILEHEVAMIENELSKVMAF
ncbi:MAG: hypothetical protein ACTHJQ_18490 [Rhizobiaceae bacterium]